MPDLGANSTLLPGSWILAVRLNPQGELQFSPGMFTGRSSIHRGTNLLPTIQTSVPLDKEATGSSVFDLDGNLLGMVVQCDRRAAIIPVEGIRAILSDTANPDYSEILHSGLEVAPISQKWQAFVKAESGLLVTDVWLGWPADQAGISAGDVIVAVNGNKVNSPAELARTLQSGQSVNLMLLRNGRSFAAKLSRENAAVPASVEFASDSGVEITTVVPGSKTQRAGLLSGDRILSIGGVRATRSTVVREFGPKGTRPLLATIERGKRQFVTVVQP
jgi:S1-C subfamily serine protease